MILKFLSKNKTIIIAIISFTLGALIYNYSLVIFQEGNPWPQIKGMVQLKFGDSDIVKLSGSDNRFMTESKNGTMIHDFMKTKGYEFTEQMGSGYFFKSTAGQTAIVTHRYYSRYYSLWTITEDIKNEENNIFNELRECLSKSDMTSHEKCSELLATIINFDDCARAGFSIMKSNPPKCATPDGRTFIQAD